LEILIGRLFYPLQKHDNWQVMPYLYGDGNTGKGTLCDLVKRMFPSGSVGVITATQEAVFGLEALFQKRLILIPDMPEKFSKKLNQSDFQSMITGEGVNIARKNKTAVSDVDWTTPILGAGNYLPDYKDNSGSISRRMVVFKYDKLVAEPDTQLKEKIVNTELAFIINASMHRAIPTCD
jgi:phage/plasmid-associated DNA primase